MKTGDTMIVVRVAHGEKPPEGFTLSDGAKNSHHGRYSLAATKIVPAKKRPAAKP